MSIQRQHCPVLLLAQNGVRAAGQALLGRVFSRRMQAQFLVSPRGLRSDNPRCSASHLLTPRGKTQWGTYISWPINVTLAC